MNLKFSQQKRQRGSVQSVNDTMNLMFFTRSMVGLMVEDRNGAAKDHVACRNSEKLLVMEQHSRPSKAYIFLHGEGQG